MIRLRLHPKARLELHVAVDWYAREAGKAIAASFVDEFDHLQMLIQERPLIGIPGHPGVRKFVFKRFPYTLVYRIRGEVVEVLALAQHGRKPEYWAGRV